MSLIKIRQLDERVATSGLFMGGDKRRRKLEPGEIVDIPNDLIEGGTNLMQDLWDTGTIDILPDSAIVTRPLDYASIREAKLCSPTYKSTDADDIADRNKALAAVEARLFETSESPPEPFEPPDGSPEVDEPEPEPPPLAADIPPPTGRVRRRAAAQANQHGAETTT